MNTPPDADPPLAVTQPESEPPQANISPPFPDPENRSVWRSQTVVAALVAATATVAVAVISVTEPWNSSPSTEGTEADSPSAKSENWKSDCEKGEFLVTGVIEGSLPEGYAIRAIIRVPSKLNSTDSGESWLVSPPAEILKGNKWQVAWKVEECPEKYAQMVILARGTEPPKGEDGEFYAP
ncbi:hypothetical protein ACFY1G_34835 [Streptomyces olivaceus]|uniref:hypothetical protein n=1 Tax=Streptomyces olivaceus TaxID=47716 RepID=UPI0022EF777E|nr:hypothetical protein [Streptomyces olivaceus]GHI99391.1 hypothetical protein TPA0906_12570 [Streptomyces olivaceus]